VLSIIHTLSSSLQHVLSLLSLLCLYQSLSGNRFQSRRSLNFRVHVFNDRRLSHNLLNSRLALHITSRYRRHRKNLSQQLFYCCITHLSRGPRRQQRFPDRPLVRIRNLLRPLPNNSRCLQSHYLATSLHATICYHNPYNHVRLHCCKTSNLT
jgi:hypothetical protein